MKKQLLSLALVLSFSVVAISQQKLHGFQEKEKPSKQLYQTKHSAKKEFSFFSQNQENTCIQQSSKQGKSSIEPNFSIEGTWGTLYNVETGKDQHFKQTYVKINENYMDKFLSTTITFMDDDFNDLNPIEIEMPENTNDLRLEGERNSSYFFMYIQYFEGGMGPDYRVSEILVIADDGTIVQRFKHRNGILFFDNDLVVLDFDDDKEFYTLYFHNSVSFAEEHQIAVPQELTMPLGGSVLTINEFEGEEYLILSYYENEFLDEYMIMNPDNRLCLDIYNTQYELEKEVRMNLIYPEQNGIYPEPAFGIFRPDYNITRNLFNDDDKWEFVLPYYTDTWMYGQWYSFYVINEDGEILKSFDDYRIIDYFERYDIEGFDNQLTFIARNDAGGEELIFFNIDSWSIDFSFPAMYNDDLLSAYAERIKIGDNFEYIIGLGYLEQVEDIYYGVIKRYDRSGEETAKILLPLGELETDEGLGFQPSFSKTTLNPYVFDTDEEIDYIYAKFSSINGTSVNIAKDNATEPYFILSRDAQNRAPMTYGFLYDEQTNAPFKMYHILSHYSSGSNTLFYDLPLISHNIDAVTIQVTTNNPNENAEGAVVKIENAGMFKLYETEVNNSGEAIFENVEAGSYTMLITKSAYHDLNTEITVSEDEIEFGPYQLMYIPDVSIKKNTVSMLNVYPNPTTNKVVIENAENISSVRVFDITGKLLKEGVNIDSFRVEIDFSILGNGVYIVNVDGEIVKVVKR